MRSSFFWTTGSLCLILSLFLWLTPRSHSERPEITDRVPLSHVTGKILVDGVPTSGVQVRYTPRSELAETRDRFLNRFYVHSNDLGDFSLSTYVDGDGIPIGEYVLEFTWLEQRFSGEVDRLDGEYSNPEKPHIQIKVEQGKDQDLGNVELRTSKKMPVQQPLENDFPSRS